MSRYTNPFIMPFVLVSLTFGACSKHKDAELQAAVDELTRLKSYSETGLSYPQFSERLLTAKANIDVALQQTSDSAAKAWIDKAVNQYVQCGDYWKIIEPIPGHLMSDVENCLKDAASVSDIAVKYALGDRNERQEWDKANEKLRALQKGDKNVRYKLDEKLRALLKVKE